MIIVNLNIPDRLLIKEFKRFLKSRQEGGNGTPKKKRYRAPNFDELHKFGVLPYVDLQLWCLQENSEITNRVFANAIFPPGKGGEEVVRKTTKKLANHWMQHLDIVLAEAANAVLENRSKNK